LGSTKLKLKKKEKKAQGDL